MTKKKTKPVRAPLRLWLQGGDIAKNKYTVKVLRQVTKNSARVEIIDVIQRGEWLGAYEVGERTWVHSRNLRRVAQNIGA